MLYRVMYCYVDCACLCMAFYGYVGLYRSMYDYVRLCSAVYW